jgi:hypothetical protein
VILSQVIKLSENLILSGADNLITVTLALNFDSDLQSIITLFNITGAMYFCAFLAHFIFIVGIFFVGNIAEHISLLQTQSCSGLSELILPCSEQNVN